MPACRILIRQPEIWSSALFTVSVEARFNASHQLALPHGSKEPLHTHEWTVTAEVCSDELNSMGLVMDFNRLKQNLDDIVADFQGKTLETIEYFHKNNSSAENVAKYIYQKMSPELSKNVRLDSVSVVEEPGCTAKFTG